MITTQKTMSSREIAEHTGKRHTHVLADIRTMLEGLEIGETKFRSSYLTAQNKEVVEYLLPQREAMILAGGYNVKVRAWFVDYFLEAQKPKTQIELIIESAKALQAVDSRLQALEYKVADIEVNKEVKPRGGFASINELHLKTGFSKDMVKIMVDKCKPKTGSASKTLPDGSVKPYTTYKIKTVMKYAKLVRKSAALVKPDGVFYRSPMVGKLKFQMK